MRHYAPGFELYTVRSLLARDFEGTLRALAGIGYREVEGSDLFGRTPEQVRHSLDALGLAAPAWHCLLDPENDASLEGAIARARALGARYLVTATAKELVSFGPQGVTLRDDLPAEGYRGIAAFLNRAGERCRAAGLVLAYHNHPVELSYVEGRRTGYDLLLEGTDPALVAFEIDLAWTVAGGADPRAFFADHPGRFPLWHAKDVNERGEDLDLGRGLVDFQAILAEADSAGLEHLFVERDTEEDPLRTARRGYAHLARWWRAPGAQRAAT